MWGSGQGGRSYCENGMSSGPKALRRKVNGNTSPGSVMNSPSPIWYAATSLWISVPLVEPFGATGFWTVQLSLYPFRCAKTPAVAAAVNSVFVSSTQTGCRPVQISVDWDVCADAPMDCETASASCSPKD